MAGSDFDDRFVMLRDGPIVPAAAYVLLLDLEARGFSVTREQDTVLVVQPPGQLTPEDCASIKRWKWHLLGLLDYCTHPNPDAYLFRDDTPSATTADTRRTV